MPDSPRPPDPPGGVRSTRGPDRVTRLAALPLGLGVATGVAAGCLVAPGPDGWGSTLGVPSAPAADLGIGWSPAVVFPEAVLAAAVQGLGTTLAWMGVATALVAFGAAATLLTAAGSLRRRELAVRGALGRGPAGLAALLLRQDGPALMAGLAVGTLAGLAGGAALHGSWPVDGSGAALLSSPGRTAPLLAAAVLACAGVAGLLVLGPLRYGVRSLAPSLAAGSRATADPREGGLRRVAAVLQMAASLALLSASLVLWRTLPPPSGDALAARAAGDDVLLLPAADPGGAGAPEGRAARYGALLDRLDARPTMVSESIASPGAWTGVGTSDFVLADCGDCMRGLMWVPFLGEEAAHHAVSPGFFRTAGMELVSGRDFTRDDGPGAEPVVIVNEPMALRNFEDGEPVGRAIRVGEGMEGWYTVVGVVRERRGPGLGLPDRPGAAIYLSLFQHPPDRVEIGARRAAPVGSGLPSDGSGPGDPAQADDTAAGLDADAADPAGALRAAALASGFDVAGEARTRADLRAEGLRPVRWAAGSATVLGLVALASALLGVHRVAAVEIAARRRELGIRLALGSTSAGLTRWVLARIVRSGLLGALLAVPPTVAVTARIRETSGDVPLFDPVSFAMLALVVLAAALAGAWGPALAAARTAPARVMAEE